ncbi:MAG: VWA domain-containing protein [Pseudomonadota bacterium]
MARKKRDFTTFNLSFLDIMSCGFGAVVLVYLIMNHSIDRQTLDLNDGLLSEVNLLEEDILDGEENLVRLRNTLSQVDLQIVEARGRASRITEQKDEYEALLETLRQDGFSSTDDVEAQKAELAALEQQVDELRRSIESDTGFNARAYIGDGNRQYLTGLNLGGKHIAILLDASASMLADRLVQIIRLRNMSADIQRNADKWVRSVSTVDWLTAQLPINSKYQVMTFNTQASFALPNPEKKWLEVADYNSLEKLSLALRDITPSGGTSLENAFTALQSLSPPPDNIFLITDGLPTQGATPPKSSNISGRKRADLFQKAIRKLPAQVPVNVILLPMEGDPMAAVEFWRLATQTQGSLLSPSEDWP